MTNTPHIVAIGGGGGATQVLQAVAPFAARRTAIIAVTDTGRSTGLARAISDIPAPGDLRATIAAFAEDDLFGRLLQHRFSGAGIPQLEGMAFGNLLLAALSEVQGDFQRAVATTADLAQCAIEVLPVSAANSQLCAELTDGTIVETELAVRGLHKPPIARLFLREPSPATAEALDAIRAADLVVVGPGSLFTTVLADLQFAGIAEALAETHGKVVYICNTTTQPGQTDGYHVLDHVRQIVETVGAGVIDLALINTTVPPDDALAAYAAEGLHLLRPDAAELQAIVELGVVPLALPLTENVGAKRALWNKQDTVRHDPVLIGRALREVLDGRET